MGSKLSVHDPYPRSHPALYQVREDEPSGTALVESKPRSTTLWLPHHDEDKWSKIEETLRKPIRNEKDLWVRASKPFSTFTFTSLHTEGQGEAGGWRLKLGAEGLRRLMTRGEVEVDLVADDRWWRRWRGWRVKVKVKGEKIRPTLFTFADVSLESNHWNHGGKHGNKILGKTNRKKFPKRSYLLVNRRITWEKWKIEFFPRYFAENYKFGT